MTAARHRRLPTPTAVPIPSRPHGDAQDGEHDDHQMAETSMKGMRWSAGVVMTEGSPR